VTTARRKRRLGVSYLHGVQRRQVRIGKTKEPVAVIRLYEGAEPNDEVILTRRDLAWLIDGMAHEGTIIVPLGVRLASSRDGA
jgi:hypothetical protein